MSKKTSNPFHGMGVALITPMQSDGAIDEPALRALVEDICNHGADFLCVLGTTAETPCLSLSERRKVVSIVRNAANGRVPLLLGAGSNCTRNVVEYLQNEDLSGIDGVLIVCPYYNKPSQEGLYQHFSTIAKATTLPVVLYNVPGRTGVNLEAATTLRLATDVDNIVAVKEASGRIEQIQEIIKGAPAGFDVLSGDDALTFDLICRGAKGVISVVGNALPGVFSKMVHAAIKGNTEEARMLNEKLTPLFPLLFVDGNPAGVKAMMTEQGKIQNALRLPLVPAKEATQRALKEFTNLDN